MDDDGRRREVGARWFDCRVRVVINKQFRFFDIHVFGVE